MSNTSNYLDLLEKSDLSICVIGGTGRSGTTILSKIFSNHPEVAKVPESRFIIDPDGLIDFYNTFSVGYSPYLYDLKVKRLESLLKAVAKNNLLVKLLQISRFYFLVEKIFDFKISPWYSDVEFCNYCPSYLDYVEDLIESLVKVQFRGTWTGLKSWTKQELNFSPPLDQQKIAIIFHDFLQKIIISVLKTQGVKHYLEKNTWNILWFDKILKLLPEAKLVHIYRDPRDVVASYLKQRWMPSNLHKAAISYKGLMQSWWLIREELPKNSFKEISLESLVSDPESILKDLCQFWNISWDQSLLTIDLSFSNSGRWKKDFDLQQQTDINLILDDELIKLGYKK